MLSKKDYKTIAAIIVSVWPLATANMGRTKQLTNALADYMAQDNPNFDRDQFIKACYE